MAANRGWGVADHEPRMASNRAGTAACVEDSDEGVALFELSESLAGWSPFGENGGMDSALVCAARKLDPGNCEDAVGNVFQALRLRRSIQLLQWEVVDGVGREHIHQLARRRLSSSSS